MKRKRSNLEVSLNDELRCWLRQALADVLALPTAPTVRQWESADLIRALSRCRAAIEAVRLYASECVEVAEAQYLSASTLRFAALATEVCRHLEEEVMFVDEELLTYAH